LSQSQNMRVGYHGHDPTNKHVATIYQGVNAKGLYLLLYSKTL